MRRRRRSRLKLGGISITVETSPACRRSSASSSERIGGCQLKYLAAALNCSMYVRLSGDWSRSNAASRMFSTSVVMPKPQTNISSADPRKANARRTGSRMIWIASLRE